MRLELMKHKREINNHHASFIIMKENADNLIQNNSMTSRFTITTSSTLYTSRKSESSCKFHSNIDQTWFWGWNICMQATRWRLLVDIPTTRWRWSNYLYSQIFLPLGSLLNSLFPNFLFFDFICIWMIYLWFNTAAVFFNLTAVITWWIDSFV